MDLSGSEQGICACNGFADIVDPCDAQYVCSRFGEILSCVCSHGFSQVTYARKVAGQAAVDNLHGKKADNGTVQREI